jgi:hypothetical protein
MFTRLIALTLWRPDQQYEMPRVTLDYAGSQPESPFNASKVALLVENRPLPLLAPLILHFMSVVPPDWRFRFMGSIESVAHLGASHAIQDQVRIGKLDVTYIPSNMSTAGQEMISRFLTNLWIYERVLFPAEWLLVYQTDSILCANSKQSLNDWLDYDWVGAPWHPEGRFGGNGGLSLRRVSSIVQILRDQERKDNSEPEDVWLSERLGYRPGAKLANGSMSLMFSAEQHSGVPEQVEHEKAKGKTQGKPPKQSADKGIDSTPQDEGWVEGIDDWREGFYEPMGYHTGDSGNTLHPKIFGTPELRKHVWDYCPEIKMIFHMDAAEYVPGDCYSNWKRDEGLMIGGPNEGMDMLWERDLEFDENGYPYLPAGLVPW